jgi:plasmid rolling circle replication initiator protein Rep
MINYDHDNKELDNVQEDIHEEEYLDVLKDIGPDGKERPWVKKKIKNELLQESYKRLSKDARKRSDKIGSGRFLSKVQRLCSCGEVLTFADTENGLKLKHAWFCRIMLCPMCSWRREIRVRYEVSEVVKVLEKDGYQFLFMTLTIKNVLGDDLSKTIDQILQAFKRMFKRRKLEELIKGYCRVLEITHDTDRKITKTMYNRQKEYYDKRNLKIGDYNPNFNKYHPHIHVMLAVNPSYFKGANYINQAEWTALWQHALRVDYNPIVDIRRVRDKTGRKKDDIRNGILETVKYPIKDTDYLVAKDPNLTDETVRVLNYALAYRRLIGFGGCFKEVYKNFKAERELHSNDEDGDDLHLLLTFRWHIGYRNYVFEGYTAPDVPSVPDESNVPDESME